MRRRGTIDDGFFLCFLFNLLFNYWWGVIAFILLVLYLLLGIPLYISLIATLVWFGVALLSTCMMIWAVSSSNEQTPQRENLNPYSAKNSDVFGASNTPDNTPDEAPETIPDVEPESTSDNQE